MKRAIVVVSVGTTYQVTIERDIALSERKIAEAFKTYDFYRAFTSETIIEQLEMRRDMKVHHIKEVLQHLFKNEYEIGRAHV